MEVIKVQMKGKSFALNLMQEELTIDEEDKKE